MVLPLPEPGPVGAEYAAAKAASESIAASVRCVCDETNVKLDMRRAAATTASLYEYTTPTRNPGSPRSLERLYTTCTRAATPRPSPRRTRPSTTSATLTSSGAAKTEPE